MFLNPNRLDQYTPTEVLEAAAQGHLGLDHRFLHAFVDRPEEGLKAALLFAERDREDDAVDLAPELIALFRQWNTPEAIPFLIRYIKEDPEEIPEDVVEFLVKLRQPALEPLLALYEELEEEESGDVAFILASLKVRNDRILNLLTERLDFDAHDTLLLLEMYGDPAAGPALDEFESGIAEEDPDLKSEIAAVQRALQSQTPQPHGEEEDFDLWSLYPEKTDLPMELLDDDERLQLLDNEVPEIRAAASNSFFNRELTDGQRKRILEAAQHDSSEQVRARSWEALTSATENADVIDAMLAALRKPDLGTTERGGLLVGLAPEADRNEVRAAILQLYGELDGRAKALEAMWRSLHVSFRDHFAKHLDDEDLEVRRGAVWGVGYHGLKGELDRIRALFNHEELRADALFAYSLAIPSEVSRGRMRGLLSRIEKDARGLSQMEEELVKAALDERLLLAGKEPFFAQEED
jgi:hypothetical protein